MYQVFQDGKPADNLNYEVGEAWNNSKFHTYTQAVTYAIQWAYPYKQSDITLSMLSYWTDQFEKNNSKADMGMSEFPVWMEIKEVD